MTGAAPRELADGKLRLDEPAPGVARLTIANPRKRNALDHPILDAITATLEELDARCLIVTGADGMFSAGYDIGEIPDETFANQAEKLVAHPFTAALEALEAYAYPTVAALGGHTIGGGLELALSCDFRVAADGIRLGMPPAKLGLVYSHTGLRKFIDTIGAPRTRELFLLGRNVDAQQALGWGMVNRVVQVGQLEAASVELAAELAANAPLSLRGNKLIIRQLLDARAAIDPQLEQEMIEARLASFASADMREGVRAFAEKRPPRWRDE